MKRFIIDLHMHSTVSDGTDTPEALRDLVKAAGIALFSVTDHDAVRGSVILEQLQADCGPTSSEKTAFLTGAEFSCRDEEGKYHILAYGYDPTAEPILTLAEKGHAFRMEKLKMRLDFLESAFGFTFPEEELAALYAMSNPGKPHIGNLMVKYGYAPTKAEAIDGYIERLNVENGYFRPEEVITQVLASGGVPVLAHPSFGCGNQLIVGEDMDRRIRRLTEYGLRGLEAFYSGFGTDLRRENLELAERYGLYVTAGSDYHGANKTVRIGDTGLTEAVEWPEGLRRFLREVCGIPERS